MQNSKNHIIGGITGGIGSSLALTFSSQGHSVSGFARNAGNGDLNGVTIKLCDATNPEAVESILNAFRQELGQIDSYTHAIGSITLKPAHLTSPEEWHNTIRQNLDSAFFALRVISKIMSKQGFGSCLFFSTAAAQVGISNHEAVAAAKGGIEAMVRSAAATYSAKGVRVNAIAPSLTETPLSQSITGNQQALEISKRMHPLGEIGQPSDIASLAAWLHSNEARFVTGQTFVVDGGISSIVPKPRV